MTTDTTAPTTATAGKFVISLTRQQFQDLLHALNDCETYSIIRQSSLPEDFEDSREDCSKAQRNARALWIHIIHTADYVE